MHLRVRPYRSATLASSVSAAMTDAAFAVVSAALREITALSSCANLTTVELSFATGLSDAWPLASCKKLESVTLTGCRALPADAVKKLGRPLPRATILS